MAKFWHFEESIKKKPTGVHSEAVRGVAWVVAHTIKKKIISQIN